MANDFGTQYVIGITLENLNALKELRKELELLRADSRTPIDFKVNVTPNTADNIGKVVEQKVAEGIEKGAKRARTGSATGGVGTDKVAFDPASLQKLDAMIGKLVNALETSGRGRGEVDAKAITDAVAAGVAGGLKKQSGMRTERRALSDRRRAELESQLEALGDLPAVKEGAVIAEKDTEKVRRLLKKRADVLGGAFAKQTEAFEKRVAAFEEVLHSTTGNAGQAFGANGAQVGKVDSMGVDYGKAAQRLIAEQQKLLDGSTKMLNERFNYVTRALDRGFDEVVASGTRTSLTDVNRQLKRSTLKLEQAFEAVGAKIAASLGTFTTTMVDRISSLNISVSAADLMPSAAAAEAARPGRTLRRQPQRRGGNPNLPPSILGDSPEAGQAATIRVGLRALEELRARERRRTASQQSAWEKGEAAFMGLPAAEARNLFEEARRYNTYLNAQHMEAARSAFGPKFGEDAPGGGARVSFRTVNELQRAARIRQQLDQGKPANATEIRALNQNPWAKALLDASAGDALPMIEAAKAMGRVTKLSRFTRAELDLPRWSPLANAAAVSHLRSSGNITDADELEARTKRMLQRAQHAGFEFTPYGQSEQERILKAINSTSGMAGGFSEFMKRRVGVHRDALGNMRASPEEWMSEVLSGAGGEWHHGPFRRWKTSILNPDQRDLAANSAIIDSGMGVNPFSGKPVSGRYDPRNEARAAGNFRAGAMDATAAAAQAAADAVASTLGGGGGAGGGGGKGPPISAGGAMPGGPGGGDWRDFAAAVKALEHVRLDGLASDFRSMAQSMSEMRKNGGSQWQQWLKGSAAGERAKERTHERDMQEQRIAMREAELAGRREKVQAWLNAQGLWGAGKMGEGVAGAVGNFGGGTDVDGLRPFGLADRFHRLNTQLGSKQLRFDELLNTYGPGGGRTPGTARALERAALEMDAKRQTMFDTVLSAGQYSPRLRSLGPDVQGYIDVSKARMRSEDERRQVLKDLDMSPKAPEGMRAKLDHAMLKDIQDWRKAEDELASSILKRAHAEFEAIRATERHGTWVDRIASKTRSLATYAMAGGLVYGAYSAATGAFGSATAFEKEMADIQGVLGNRTATERDQVRAGVLRASIDYGTPLASTSATAKIFAQTGIGVDRTISQTRAALSGQLGAGLDPHQSTEMLIAVDNITRGVVSASDVLDRISRVEAKYAVTAQDLSSAVQRVGSLATQLQPGRVGRLDALDFVIGATTTQIQQTRAGGDQTANALKFMLSRLGSPHIMGQLQETYGIKLAANAGGTEMRPLFDIFGDLAKKYKDLLGREADGTSRTGIANQFLQVVAGQRQTNQAAALLGNWDDTMKAATESARAWGDTQRRVTIQMDTWSFQIDRTKNAFVAFTSELLKSAGVLTLLKGGAHLLGSGADTMAQHPLLSPLVAGLAVSAVGYGARRLAGSALVSGAMTAFEAGSGGLGTAIAAEGGSLLRLLGLIGLRLGAIITGLGTAAAVIGVGAIVWNRMHDRGPLANPDLGDANLSGSDLYKNYQSYAQDNGMSASGLYQRVGGAVARAQALVRGNPRYRGMPDIFTTDDDRRQYAKTLAGDTTKAFVDEVSRAVPAIGKIADEAERTAAALMLLKQSAMVGQMQSSYVASFQDEQLAGLTKKLQANVLGMSQKGEFGWKAGQSFGGQDNLKAMEYFDHAFGVFAGPLSSTKLLGGDNKIGTIVDMTVERMRKAGETFGQAFDAAASAALELTSEQLSLVERLKRDNKLSGDPTKERDQLIGLLGTSRDPLARATRRGLMNQKLFEGAIYENLKSAIPLVENTMGGENQGGMRGANIVFEAVMRAARRRTDDIRRAGQTGAASAMEASLTAMQNPKNRDAFNMIVVKGGNYRAQFRDRILESILSYDAADSSAREGGGALKRLGIGADVTAERSQAANAFVRSLYGARAQVRGDVLRAGSKLAMYSDLAGAVGNAGAVDMSEQENQRRADAQKGFYNAVSSLNPDERKHLETQLAVARQVAGQINDNSDVFGGLQGPEQQLIRQILAPGFNKQSLDKQVLSFLKITEIAERIAQTMDARLTEEQLALQKVQLDNAAQQQIMHLRQEALRVGRGLTIKYTESFGGAGAATGLRLSDIRQNYGDEVRLAKEEYAGKIREYDKVQQQTGRGMDKERAAAQADLDAKIRAAAGKRGTSRTELEADAKLSRDQRDASYLTRYLEIPGGPLGRLQGALASARRAGSGTPAEEEALREYQLSVRQRYYGQAASMTQSATQGLRGALLSYDTFKGPALGARILKPLADTVTGQVTNSFFSTLVGPQGLLGDKLAKTFNAQMFLEADMIKNAHVAGITQGFQMVYGGSGGAADGATGVISTSSISRKDQLKQLALTGAIMGGNILGGSIGTRKGVNNGSNYGSEGAQLGSTLGAGIGLLAGPLGGAVGGVLGGLVGGLFGGRLGKGQQTPEFAALDRIDRNTRETVQAIDNQTRMLVLESRLLNVPASFRVPRYAVAGAGGEFAGMNVNITVNESGSARNTAQQVVDQLRTEVRGAGSFVSPRGTRN
jgi:hypothetical protein